MLQGSFCVERLGTALCQTQSVPTRSSRLQQTHRRTDMGPSALEEAAAHGNHMESQNGRGYKGPLEIT